MKKTKTKKLREQNFGHSINPKKEKKDRQARVCPICGASIKKIPLEEMCFNQTAENGYETAVAVKTAAKNYWVCANYPACDTYIREDEKTGEPYGLLAGKNLRRMRIILHKFEYIFIHSGYSRDEYRYMIGYALGITNIFKVHTRFMTEYQTKQAIDCCIAAAKSNKKVLSLINPGTLLWEQLHPEDSRHLKKGEENND